MIWAQNFYWRFLESTCVILSENPFIMSSAWPNTYRPPSVSSNSSASSQNLSPTLLFKGSSLRQLRILFPTNRCYSATGIPFEISSVVLSLSHNHVLIKAGEVEISSDPANPT
jgi:hypothetical protein